MTIDNRFNILKLKKRESNKIENDLLVGNAKYTKASNHKEEIPFNKNLIRTYIRNKFNRTKKIVENFILNLITKLKKGANTLNNVVINVFNESFLLFYCFYSSRK